MSGRAAVLVASLAALGSGAAAPALATDGNVYPGGPGLVAHVDPQFTTAVAQGIWTIAAPALAPADAGPKWRMSWPCAPGTELAAIQFSGLRYADASNMGLEATSGGRRLWVMGDAELPGSPNPGKDFSVALPPGLCDAELTLFQGETRKQHARIYWIGNPRVLVRDVEPPTGRFRSVPRGWIGAAASGIHVEWSAADNLGADGIAGSAVLVGGQPKWLGAGAVGDLAADLDLAGVPDGAQKLVLRLDGDGTAPGLAEDVIQVDRTPAVASAPVVTPLPQAGRVAAKWSATDATSGVAASYLQLNAAPDGTGSGEWITLRGTPGPGERVEADIDATPAGQGLHAVRVLTFDVAGNLSGAAGQAPVMVDTIAPELRLAPLPEGPVSQARVSYEVSDGAHGAGVGSAEIEVNTAPDGSDAGSWQRVSEHQVGPGSNSEVIPLTAFASGPHRMRVRAHNAGPAGATLFGEQSGEVTVDSTTPTLANVRFEPAASHELKVSWIADDAGAGVAGAAVQWLDGGRWATLVTAPAGSGPGSAVVPVESLPGGPQRLRLIVLDAVGNAAVQTQLESGSLVDHAPPAIADLRLSGPPWTLSWSQSDPDGGFGDCPAAVAVSSGESEPWRTLLSLKLGEGAQSVSLPVGDLPAGVYRTRVSACDAAGNRATAELGGLVVEARAGGPASAAQDPGRYRGARLEVRAAGGTAGSSGARHLRFGQSLAVTGRLRDRRGAPLASAPIEIREPGGRSLGDAVTDRAGRFRIVVRPALGPLAVGVPVNGRLLPTSDGRVAVRVLPRVSFLPSSPVATAGGAPVVFRGRFEPSPARLGIRAGKRIDLRWRDPASGDWRVMTTSGLAADGSFSIPWVFGSVGYTFSMRVRVTGELGWPFPPTDSATAAVTARSSR